MVKNALRTQIEVKKMPFVRKMQTGTVCYLLLLTSLSFNIAAQDLQDPTKPVSYQANKAQTKRPSPLPKLSAIITREGEKRALFNTSSKQVGQHISGFKISKIGSDFVILKRNEQYYRLTLFPSVSKSVNR